MLNLHDIPNEKSVWFSDVQQMALLGLHAAGFVIHRVWGTHGLGTRNLGVPRLEVLNASMYDFDDVEWNGLRSWYTSGANSSDGRSFEEILPRLNIERLDSAPTDLYLR